MGVDYTKEGKIATFIINRPLVMNALDVPALTEFHDALIDFNEDRMFGWEL